MSENNPITILPSSPKNQLCIQCYQPITDEQRLEVVSVPGPTPEYERYYLSLHGGGCPQKGSNDNCA